MAAQKTAEADVAASKASLQSAQINLGYASVTAPISGRIGRALVTEGALVGQGEATPLAVVQQINPMYVNFTQSTTEVLDLRRAVESGRFKAPGAANAASVGIVLEDGSVYPQAGKLLFSDLTVDPTSGQITLRAEGAESEGLPAAEHVRAGSPRAGADADRHRRAAAGGAARLRPATASWWSTPKARSPPRPVKVGTAQGGNWVILDGVKTGEMVMVDGFQKLRGNAPVKPVPWQPAGAGSAPGSAATAAAAASTPR